MEHGVLGLLSLMLIAQAVLECQPSACIELNVKCAAGVGLQVDRTA